MKPHRKCTADHALCGACDGSGQGGADGTRCQGCGGGGEIPCDECDALRDRAEEARRDA